MINITELENFFEQLNKVDLSTKKEEAVKPQVELEKMRAFFTDFKEIKADMQEDVSNGLFANVWSAANLKSDEVRNSKVLRYFLDSTADHGQKDRILMAFLSLLKPPFSKQKSQHYLATEECCPLGEQKDRVDIEIDAEKYLMFIEVKINATEGEQQLQRYINAAQAKCNERPWCVVYLTLTGEFPKARQDYQKNPNIICISWKQVAELFLEYGKDEPNNLGAWLLRQFAKHIKTFY